MADVDMRWSQGRRGGRRFGWPMLWTVGVMGLIGLNPEAGAEDGARPRLAFIGLHGGAFERIEGFSKGLGFDAEYVADDRIARREVDFSRYRLVFVEHARSEDRDAYRDLFRAARKADPRLRIFAIGPSPRAFFDPDGAGVVEDEPRVKAYYPSSPENLRRWLSYLSATYLEREGTIEPPAEVDESGFHHPDHEGRFGSVAEFVEWSAARGRDPAKLPRALVAVHLEHLTFQQPRVVDALVRAFEDRGVLASAIIDKNPAYEAQVKEFQPDVVVHTCHCSDTVEFRREVDVPHLHSLFFREQSIDRWRENDEGLAPGEAAFQVVSQERLGAIEPLVGAGTIHGQGGDEAFSPIPDRIDHLVDRAVSWIRLRRASHAEKRVVVVYFDREMGKGDLMRGSATGMFLNGPRSLVKVLKRMKQEGYRLTSVPADDVELVAWLQERGRQIGLWDADALDRLARSGQAALVPEAVYRDWFLMRVPASLRAEVVRHWGTPPGSLLVWTDDQGERFIVIPRIDLGNVVLLPQPLRGEAHDPSMLHNGKTPPPHNYLATYFWLQEDFRANAVVHFGTHGSEFALPGKAVGLSARDWPNLLMGAMPNVNPWIIDNPGETAPAKRRASAVLIGHLTPPIVAAGLSDELLNLQGLVEKWEALEDDGVRESFRRQITADVDRLHLDLEIGRTESDRPLLSPERLERLAEYLHEIAGESTPVSLHVLGEPPRDDLLIPYLVTILKPKFLDALGEVVGSGPGDAPAGGRTEALRREAEKVVELVVRRGFQPTAAVAAIGGKTGRPIPSEVEKGLTLAADLARRFGQTGQEIDNLIRALDGRFIPPGPVNSPVRNPGAVPTGRNLAMLNPDEIPARPSWEVGKALVDQLLKRSMERKGRYPAKIAFSLSSFATFRDFGVMESQILYLMGVEPVWDDRDLVQDVRLIPAEVLRRPRIDVFIAPGGYYESNLPGRLLLIDKAIRLAAAQKEPGNAVHDNARKLRDELTKRGVAAERAEALASARIFGREPGQFSPGDYYYLVERSGLWNSREELIERYLSGAKHVFTKGHWGEDAPEAYDAAIQGTDAVLRSWSDHLTGPLSNKYAWFAGGSLALAVKHLTDVEPEYILSDVRDADKAGIVRAEDALAREFRARLFNRKWIEGMMKEGYAGADQVSVMVSNSMGWSIMRPGSVPDETWNEIEAVFVRDRFGLSVREWFESANPSAFQDMTEVLLETARKGYWKASPESVARIAEAHARSVVRHGEGGGLRGGGNVALQRYVERALKSAGASDLAELAERYRAKSEGAGNPTAELVAESPAPASNASAAPPPPSVSASPAPPPAGGDLRAKGEALAAETPAPPDLQPAAETVQGARMAPAETAGESSLFPWLLGGAAVALVLGGFTLRRTAE